MSKKDFNPEDIVGNRYGKIKIASLSRKEPKKWGGYIYFYNCVCDCGNIFEARRDAIFKKETGIRQCVVCKGKQLSESKTKHKDLTGEVFGKLTVIKKLPEFERNESGDMYQCQCSCENKTIINVRGNSLLRKNGIKSCGCARKNPEKRIKNQIGKTVNQWKKIEYKGTQKNNKDKDINVFLCECECCREKREIRNDKITKTFCEKRRELNKALLQEFKESPQDFPLITPNKSQMDLIGKEFEGVTVIGYVGRSIINVPYWLCQCKRCGEYKIMQQSILHGTGPQSCGCMNTSITSDKNSYKLQGMVFGRLTVLERVRKSDKYGVFWKCKCECGNTVTVSGTSLVNGHTRSCGCLKSKGEFQISKFLSENHINFSTQYYDNNCRYKNVLRFDFQIFYDEKNFFLCEYQGIQHYEPVKMISTWTDEFAQEQFKIRTERDNIKKEFCLKNNIKLLLIPYWDFNNIELILRKELNLERKEEETVV